MLSFWLKSGAGAGAGAVSVQVVVVVVAIHDGDNDGGGDSGVMLEGVQGWEVRDWRLVDVNWRLIDVHWRYVWCLWQQITSVTTNYVCDNKLRLTEDSVEFAPEFREMLFFYV